MNLIKPQKFNPGDKVATVSLAWGCAGNSDMRWCYDLGVLRLQNEFGLEAVAMPHSLKGEAYIRDHLEARAEDLMMAFADPLCVIPFGAMAEIDCDNTTFSILESGVV